MAELLGLQARLIGMNSRHAVEEAAGDVAKMLASNGVKFAISLGKAG